MIDDIQALDLVARNERLIGYVINACNLDYLDDAYGELAEAFLKAAKYYDPERGSFSNFAIFCLKQHARKIQAIYHKKRCNVVADSFEMVQENFEMSDRFDNYVELKMTLENVLAECEPIERDMFIMYMNTGHNYKCIQDFYGIENKSVVQAKIQKIQRRIKQSI